MVREVLYLRARDTSRERSLVRVSRYLHRWHLVCNLEIPYPRPRDLMDRHLWNLYPGLPYPSHPTAHMSLPVPESPSRHRRYLMAKNLGNLYLDLTHLENRHPGLMYLSRPMGHTPPSVPSRAPRNQHLVNLKHQESAPLLNRQVPSSLPSRPMPPQRTFTSVLKPPSTPPTPPLP